MFLEDEFAARRVRARRVSISLMVAVVAVTASSLMISGLISAAHADEGRVVSSSSTAAAAGVVPDNGQALIQLAASPIMVASPAAMTTQHTASQADQQIMRGLTVMLLALMATSALAVWHRRLRGLLGIVS